jgi:hypothetical protein
MKHLISFLFFITAGLYGQAQIGDSLLLNETKLTRPINLHNRQFRFSGDYGLALTSVQYEETKKRPSKETGRTRTYAEFNFDFRYGISEYWQVRVNLMRTVEIVTEPAFLDAFGDDFYLINYSSEKIGWKDPELWFDYRLPFTGRRTDIILSAGATISIMKNGSEKPRLRIQPSGIVFDEDISFEQLSTVEKINSGEGTNYFNYGLQFKQRFKYWAFNFQSVYYLPTQNTQASRWMLTDTGFDYVEERFNRQVPDQLFVNTGIEFQLKPWLNIAGDLIWYRSRNGWNEIQDQKLLVPVSKLIQLGITYEIMASKRLWIGQAINITTKAENIYAPLLLTSYLKYNLFL